MAGSSCLERCGRPVFILLYDDPELRIFDVSHVNTC
jgi:hypothetical protein